MNEEIRCRKCGLELYEGEKTCPNCGARAWGPAAAIWFFWFILFFVVFLAFLAMEGR